MSTPTIALINKFNGLNNKTILHIRDMQNLKPYPILKMSRVTTKYGECIKIEVDKHLIFLPHRYNIITDEEIIELSSGSYVIKKESGEDDGESYQILLETIDIAFMIPQNGQYPIWQ